MEHYLKTTTSIAALAACALGCIAVGQTPDPCEPQRLVSPPEIPTSSFGSQIVTNGQYWFVSDSSARTRCAGSALECGTGAVFVYKEFDGRLELVQTIVPPDVQLYDFFGSSMDVDGDRLIVGSMGAQWPGTGVRQGIAYIYELEDGQWVEVTRLEPPAEVTELFGSGVYLSGDVALAVSSRPVRNAYQYERVNGAWILQGTVPQPDPLVWNDCFGCSGVAWGDWFFLGAYNESATGPRSGSVYVYRRQADNTLRFAQKIESDDTRGLGVSLDFDGRTLAISAALSDREVQYQGAILAYTYDGERWRVEQEMVHAMPLSGAALGFSVAVQGDVLLTSENATRSSSVQGRVIRFERRPGLGWQEVGELVPEPPVYARRFGQPVAFHGDRALIGAPDEVDASFRATGAAYLFDLSCLLCPPDLDADGRMTVFDFLTFLNLFDDGDATADFDGDGDLTVFDFLAFQTAFDAGC